MPSPMRATCIPAPLQRPLVPESPALPKFPRLPETPLSPGFAHAPTPQESAPLPPSAQPLPSATPEPSLAPAPFAAPVRRRIPPLSGRALEILGHAIEYLADEYVLACGVLPSIDAHDPQIEAIQILKQANRAIYFECPVIPPWHARLKARLLRTRPLES
jgi:hypothetical protein